MKDETMLYITVKKTRRNADGSPKGADVQNVALDVTDTAWPSDRDMQAIGFAAKMALAKVRRPRR